MKNKGFTIIDNNILRDTNLNGYERYFLIALKSFDHKGVGEVYPTYETLMKLFGTTKRNTIAKIIKSLKDKNYITISKKNRANCYKFIKDYLLVNPKEDEIEDIINGECDNEEDKNCSIDKVNKNSNENIDDNKVEELNITKEVNNNKLKDITENSQENGNKNEYDINQAQSNTKNSIQKDTTNSSYMDTINSNLKDTDIKESNNNSSSKDTTSSNHKDTSNSIQGDTLKIKEKNTKEIYINIFNTWNDTDIYNEDKLTMRIVNSITMALRKYTLEEILTAIKNYKEVYYSDYYYDYTWSLSNFLAKPNALRKFTEDGEIWTNYKTSNKNPNKEKYNLAELID